MSDHLRTAVTQFSWTWPPVSASHTVIVLQIPNAALTRPNVMSHPLSAES